MESGSEKPLCVPQVFMDWTWAVVVLQVLIQPCLSGKHSNPEQTLGKLPRTELIQVWLWTHGPPGRVGPEPADVLDGL